MSKESNRSISMLTIVKGIVSMLPALIIIVVTLGAGACGDHSPFAPLTTTPTPTGLTPTISMTATVTFAVGMRSTPAPTSAGGFAFVTNFADGNVSSYSRDASTGALTLMQTANAGAEQGPQGVAVSQDNHTLYVANYADDNIYEFAISPITGNLTALPGAPIANGHGSGPQQIALNPAHSLPGDFAWVTGGKDGTITTYTIGAGGLLSYSSHITGLAAPFAIAIDPAAKFLYASDFTAGVILSYQIDPATGALTQSGAPVNSLGASRGKPAFVTLDPTGNFLYADDNAAGVVSVFNVSNGTPVFVSQIPSQPTRNAPFGMGAAASVSGKYLIAANQGGASLSAFLIDHPQAPGILGTYGNRDLSQPTGLAIDADSKFAYTTNMAGGTVSQFTLNASCPKATAALCYTGSAVTENPPNPESQPYGIALTR